MSRVISKLRSYSFLYDFSVRGGNVSTINMGEFLPPGSSWLQMTIKGLANVNSGGAATVAVGLTGLGTGVLLPATAMAALPLVGEFTWADAQAGAQNHVPSGGAQMTMTIGTAALTSGKFVFTVMCVELPL